jgi:transposase
LVDTSPFVAEKEDTMPRGRKPYPKEFREQIVALRRAGRSVKSLADEFKLDPGTVINWSKQAELDGGDRSDGLTTDEKKELAKLRKRVRELEVERDILSKAAAWFARETGSIPKGSSNS